MEGAINPDYSSYCIDLLYKPSEYTPYLTVMVPEQYWMPESRELGYVAGSFWAVADIFGECGNCSLILCSYKQRLYFVLGCDLKSPHISYNIWIIGFTCWYVCTSSV